MKYKLKSDERALVENFIKCFIPKHRQSRWKVILDSDSSKWKKLSMDDLWLTTDSSSKMELINIEAYLSCHTVLANQKALLVKLSGGGCIEKGVVRVLVDQLVYEDSLILLPSEKISLASHHSGDWLVCSDA